MLALLQYIYIYLCNLPLHILLGNTEQLATHTARYNSNYSRINNSRTLDIEQCRSQHYLTVCLGLLLKTLL